MFYGGFASTPIPEIHAEHAKAWGWERHPNYSNFDKSLETIYINLFDTVSLTTNIKYLIWLSSGPWGMSSLIALFKLT